MSRATLRNILANDATMQTYIASDDWYAFSAPDTPPNDTFAVMRWDATIPDVGPGSHNVTLWVYDVLGDYSRVDAIIARAKDLLAAAVHVSGPDGFITQAQWTGDSQDFSDDVYERVVRTSTYRVGVR